MGERHATSITRVPNVCVRVCLSLHVRVCVGGGACKRFASASERACVRACESPLKMTQNAQERGE